MIGVSVKGRISTLPPFENRNGVATSQSPLEMVWEGNEDVAAPFEAGAVSRCARCEGFGEKTLGWASGCGEGLVG